MPRVLLRPVALALPGADGLLNLGPVEVVFHGGGVSLGVAEYGAVGRDDGDAGVGLGAQLLRKLVEGRWRSALLHKRPHEVLRHLSLGGQVRLDVLAEVILYFAQDVQPEAGEGGHDEENVGGGGAKAEAPQHP